MNLYSNFSYLLDDPSRGDQFQQVDDRHIMGASYHHHWNPIDSNTLEHRWGATVQHDDIGAVGLHRTQGRQRTGTVRQDAVQETSLGAYYEAIWSLAPRWRAALLAAATLAAYRTATLGKAGFAASYAEDQFAGQMWYFGWIATAAALAGLVHAVTAMVSKRAA